MNPDVEKYLARIKCWKDETEQLRRIILDTGLYEDYKWMHPCYTWHDNNVVLIHGFNDYCALLFFKGALLKDTDDMLVQQTENVQAARQIRFTNVKDILRQESAIKTYIYQAIEVEKSGQKVEMKKTADFEMADELAERLNNDPKLSEAFYSLTPGRQRGYLLYFSQAKQAKTRESRIDKCIPMIMEGKGLNDR